MGTRRWLGVGRQDLNKHLALADHAQIGPRTLFERAGACLKILNFRGERRIAGAQPFIDLALLGDLPLQGPDAEPPALTPPERVLDQSDQCDQDDS